MISILNYTRALITRYTRVSRPNRRSASRSASSDGIPVVLNGSSDRVRFDFNVSVIVILFHH